MAAMERSLCREAALQEFRLALPAMGIDELREHCSRLAELAIVVQPAAMSWLAGEAAASLQASIQQSHPPLEGMAVVARFESGDQADHHS